MCVGFCHNERCPDAIEMYSPTARAILPFIYEARIEGGKMVQAACVNLVDDLEVQYSDTYDAAVSDAYTAIRALNVEDIVK